MPKSIIKRKAGGGATTKLSVETAKKSETKNKPDPDLNEEIDSDSDLESRETDSDVNDRLVDEEDEETVQERKIRMAKRLIEKIQQQKEDDLNDREQHDFVSKKLEEDLQAKTGKLRKEVAERYTGGEIEKRLRGHRLTVTCLVVSPDIKFVFSGSKDGSIVKWNFETGAKVHTIRKRTEGVQETSTGHRGEILCLALTQDFKFLASSGRDRSVRIWKPDTCEFVYNFEGHRDAVSGLAFRLNSHDLYSCSFDRSVKIWNVDQLAYAETLFGHQDSILGIDSLNRERCVTCGGRDRTVRIWKIVEESQLVFNGTHFDSIDCICYLNEEFFFSGSNDSSLAVWNINKKKPIVSVKNAHGVVAPSVTATAADPHHVTNGHNAEQQEKLNHANGCLFDQSKPTHWISSVAAFHNSDLLASGSDDGYIKVWSFQGSTNSLKEIFKIQINGFINDLKFSQDGQYLIAAVGQEHKLGRWSSHKSAKNEVVVVKLNTTNEQQPKLLQNGNTNKKLKV